MIETLHNVFNNYETKLNFKGIKKALGISRQKKDDELRDILIKLELDGILYCNDEGVYSKFPFNFFVAQVEFSTKGNPYINVNNEKVMLPPTSLNGINAFDVVIFSKEGKHYEPKKILKRNIKELVCEVKIDDEKQKFLEVCNLKTKIKVRIDTKNMKKLVEGQRVLVSLSIEKYDNCYDGNFIKVIGHKNDLDTELKTIAYNNGFSTEYPNEVLQELDDIPDEVTEEELKGRVDKRNDKVFTIDGSHTKDIDDAVEIKMLPNGNFNLIVSIAHVSHYVKQGSAIWQFAEANTTSLYLVDRVMAMLHSKLSNGICSLNPDVDRLARSFEMEINPYGDVVNFKTYKSVIHSKKKMTYDDVNQIIENNTIPSGYEDYVDDILLLNKLSKVLSTKRNNNGAVDFANKELEFIVDDDGEIRRSINEQRSSQKIIENCMVVANTSVSKYFFDLLVPFVYRNHEFPITDKVKETYQFLKGLGYRLEKIDSYEDARVIQKIIRSLVNKDEFVVLSVLILQSMQRAYYSKENRGHFGLAESHYSQTTSPIRRFLDLVIHTIIDYYEELENNLDNITGLDDYLEKVCSNATLKERCADKAEYEADQLYMVKSMESHIGEEFYGFVSSVSSTTIGIKTTELIDGVCLYDITGTGYTYYPESKMLVNKNENVDIHIGSKVKVVLNYIDLGERQIYFGIKEINLQEALIRTREKN